MTTSPEPSAIKTLHQRLTRGFKIYGGLLWAVFLIFAILVPSMNGAGEKELKQLASRAFVILLIAYYLPYFISWKVFERKYGKLEDEDKTSEK